MNRKRAFIAFAAAFVFIFFFGFVWHGILTKPAYVEISDHWRSDPDFQSHFWVLVLGHAVIAFAFTCLYAGKAGAHCAGSGASYGFVVGILCSGAVLLRFATEPLTTKILWMLIAGDLIMFTLMGALIGLIYRPLADR